MAKRIIIWIPALALTGAGLCWMLDGSGQLVAGGESGRAGGNSASLASEPTRGLDPIPAKASSGRLEGVFRDAAGEEKGEALKLVFPEPELPGIVNVAAISESLTLLAKNGSDLSKPMASRHRVMAATPEVAAQLAEWAKTNGFTSQEPELALGHGGVKRYAVELVRKSVPDAAALEREGREVFAGAGQIPGAWYQTWQGEIVR